MANNHLTGSKWVFCSAFLVVVPEYVDTPPPADPSDLQRKGHPWVFSAAVAHNFCRFCPPTLYQWAEAWK